MKAFNPLNRRQFLSTAAGMAVAGTAMAALPAPRSTTTIGLIADPHHGLAPDAEVRLDAFMAAVHDCKPDLLLQLGDFCHPPRAVKSATAFLQKFESFGGPRYHVVGNHDLDLAQSKREILEVWGAEKSFYSFDHGGFHVAVLDCNFVRNKDGKDVDWSPARSYEGRVSAEQIEWLKADLERTGLATIVVSHQGFGPKTAGGVVPNGDEIRAVIAAANKGDKGGKVVLCMHGHNHLDGATTVDGVHYLQG